MPRQSLAAVVAALLFTGTANAQGVADLPDRPIMRAEVVAVVKRQFAAMDANHDGAVSEREFDAYRARQENLATASGVAAFDRIGPRWFERADVDGDGAVTLDEAMARPLQFFDLADTDRDGVVSVAEQRLAALVMSLGGR